MLGMTMTKVPHKDHYLTIRNARNSEQQGEWETILVSYFTLNHTSKNEKVPTTAVGNTRSN